MKQAFSRVNAFIIAMTGLIEKFGPVIGRQMAGAYQSRGKGQGKMGKNYFKSKSSNYPFSNKRQHERADKHYMKLMPNGHWIMQQLSGKEIREMREERVKFG